MVQGVSYSPMVLTRSSVEMGKQSLYTSSMATSSRSNQTRQWYAADISDQIHCTHMNTLHCYVPIYLLYFILYTGVLLCRLQNDPHNLPRWTRSYRVPKVNKMTCYNFLSAMIVMKSSQKHTRFTNIPSNRIVTF